MVKVYFEMKGGSYSELVAVLDSEEMYERCLPVFEEMCKENGFDLVTESVDEERDMIYIDGCLNQDFI